MKMPACVEFIGKRHRVDGQRAVYEVPVGGRPHLNPAAACRLDGGPGDVQFLFSRKLEEIVRDSIVACYFCGRAEDSPGYSPAQPHFLHNTRDADGRFEINRGVVVVDEMRSRKTM